MSPQLLLTKYVCRKKALKMFKNILYTNYVMLKLVLPSILVNLGQRCRPWETHLHSLSGVFFRMNVLLLTFLYFPLLFSN